MIAEIVLWKMPDGMSREEIVAKFKSSVPTWQANQNLIHKAFLFDETSRRGGGVYLWKNIEAAKQAHGPAFQDRIKSIFGASPEFQYFDAPVVIDKHCEAGHRQRSLKRKHPQPIASVSGPQLTRASRLQFRAQRT